MKKIIRILNLDIHSLNNAEYKNFMERFFKLIPLKAVSGEGDRPSELRLLGEEENMTSDFVGISDEDKATFNADRALADGGQRLLRRQRLTNTCLKVQALKPRGGKNDRVVLAAIELA